MWFLWELDLGFLPEEKVRTSDFKFSDQIVIYIHVLSMKISTCEKIK